ncbi:MAG: periplasmic protein TonB [Sphingomonadales bacterium]|jgi:protein TonB|nr:periplasmic protein TonB [Sphingomonadales bacterium]
MIAAAGVISALLGSPGAVPPRPLTDPAAWFDAAAAATDPWPDRWPGEAMVAYRVRVGKDGRVAECSIVRSTGYGSLDRATCDALARYGRFEPARDADGRAVRGEWSGRTRWTDIVGTVPEPERQ